MSTFPTNLRHMKYIKLDIKQYKVVIYNNVISHALIFENSENVHILWGSKLVELNECILLN